MSNDNSFSPIGIFNLPEKAVDYIEKQCIKVPWFFFKDCAYGNEAEEKGLPLNPYFSHTFLDVSGRASATFSTMPWNEIGSFIGIANNICKHYGATLTLLHVVPENSRTTETIKHRSEEKLKQSKVTASVEVVKSSKPVDTIAEISASYDLLILGTPEKDNWIKVLFGGGKDKFTERAACSVLRITLKD